jgi:hypothetical protein
VISILKLANGQEIVGNITSINDSTIRVHKPLTINYRQYFGGTPQVFFNRYVFFAETTEITFKQSDVMHQVLPRDAFKLYYKEVVDHYYSEMDNIVDAELEELVHNIRAEEGRSDNSMTQEEAMEKLLTAFPIKGKLVN